MHWTALLSQRKFSDDAQIKGDLECIGCGYNLRSATMGGRCSECGLPVTESMFELAHPERVAEGFRRIARSALFMFALIIPPIIPVFMAMDLFLLVGGLLVFAGAFRLWGSATLRFQAALAQLPVIGTRLKVMFSLNLIEYALLIGTVLIWYIALANSAALLGTAGTWKWYLGGAWLTLAIMTHLATVLASLSIASMLEYDMCRRELIRSILFLVTSPLLGLLVMIAILGLILATGSQINTSIIRVVGIGSMIFVALISLAYGITAWMRLAGAAEHEHDSPDHLVDTERSELPHRTTQAKEEMPDITLE